MSRLNDLIERIEAIAHKLEMSVEEVVSIVEGKHPTHKVIVAPPTVPENPTPAPAPAPAPAVAQPITTSTPVDASVAAQNQAAAGSTEFSAGEA